MALQYSVLSTGNTLQDSYKGIQSISVLYFILIMTLQYSVLSTGNTLQDSYKGIHIIESIIEQMIDSYKVFCGVFYKL